MSDKPNVFVGCPMYDGKLESATAAALMASASHKYSIMLVMNTSSLLCLNCNGLWSAALSARDHSKLKWFALLHADIVPDAWWLDTLIDEAEANDADVMSAVVPIKDMRGVTSTAISNPENEWSPYCRLTQAQLHHESFPQTFDLWSATTALCGLPGDLMTLAPSSELMVNTGCFVCRVDRPWSHKVKFEIRDRISQHPDGTYFAQVISEDWMFSKAVASFGGKVMATQKVKIAHRGLSDFHSDQTWGNVRDDECAASMPQKMTRVA